jgi:hypothetical protein
MAGRLINGELEYFVAVRAKNGDKIAVESLWNSYKFSLIGMLKSIHQLSYAEKVSEVSLLFFHKLELFDPEKVKKKPEDWTFSYMLTGGMKNLCWHLKHYFLRDSRFTKTFVEYDPTDALDAPVSSDYPIGKERIGSYFDKNPYDYLEKNNPEILAMRCIGGSLRERAGKFYERLSSFDKTILEFRRAGLPLREIADEMGCGYLKIRIHIAKMKEIASFIFGISYMKA